MLEIDLKISNRDDSDFRISGKTVTMRWTFDRNEDYEQRERLLQDLGGLVQEYMDNRLVKF